MPVSFVMVLSVCSQTVNQKPIQNKFKCIFYSGLIVISDEIIHPDTVKTPEYASHYLISEKCMVLLCRCVWS